MTPFRAKGYTKDTKFKVVDAAGTDFSNGEIVWLAYDDNTTIPRFTNEDNSDYLNIESIEPIEPQSITKDTVFDLKVTGDELVYLAIILGETGCADTIDDILYGKVADILKGFASSDLWVDATVYDVYSVIDEVFPPQETPEMKQYKELLAEYKALGERLAQLEEKFEGKA